ncbi:MAG: methylmalonyl-CoA epimerase [Pseudomonadota bacterium]
MIHKIAHIAIAVKNLKEQTAFYRDLLGLEPIGQEELPDQGVRVAYFRVGDSNIELLEPLSPDGTVAKFIQKRGEGIHHIAYEVADLQHSLNFMQENDVELIDKTPRRGGHGYQIGFLHPRSTFGVLTELCEPTSNCPKDSPKNMP